MIIYTQNSSSLCRVRVQLRNNAALGAYSSVRINRKAGDFHVTLAASRDVLHGPSF